MQVNNQQSRLENLEVIVAEFDKLELSAGNQARVNSQIELLKSEIKQLKLAQKNPEPDSAVE